jgi:hypothetical protein
LDSFNRRPLHLRGRRGRRVLPRNGRHRRDGRVGQWRLASSGDDFVASHRRESSWGPRARKVLKSLQALANKARAPPFDGPAVNPDSPGYSFGVLSLSTRQNDSSSQDVALRRCRGTHATLELCLLLGSELDLQRRASPPSYEPRGSHREAGVQKISSAQNFMGSEWTLMG